MQFKEHLVDDTIRSVYGLEVADINGDGQEGYCHGLDRRADYCLVRST